MSSELRISKPWGSVASSSLNITAKCKVFAGRRVFSNENFYFRKREPIAKDIIVSTNTIITALQVLLKIRYTLWTGGGVFHPTLSQGHLLISQGWRLQTGRQLVIVPTTPRDFGCRGDGSWGVRASLSEAHSPASTQRPWVMTELYLVASGSDQGVGLSLGPVSRSVGGSSSTSSESFRFRINILR